MIVSLPMERLIKALIVAKCARFTMATCVSASYVAPDEWCEVCKVLDALGYEPYVVSNGGLESWRKTP